MPYQCFVKSLSLISEIVPSITHRLNLTRRKIVWETFIQMRRGHERRYYLPSANKACTPTPYSAPAVGVTGTKELPVELPDGSMKKSVGGCGCALSSTSTIDTVMV